MRKIKEENREGETSGKRKTYDPCLHDGKIKNWNDLTDVLRPAQTSEAKEFFKSRLSLYDDFTKSKDKSARTILDKKEMEWIYQLEVLRNHFKNRGSPLKLLEKHLDSYYDLKLSENGEGFKHVFAYPDYQREEVDDRHEDLWDRVKKVKGKFKIR